MAAVQSVPKTAMVRQPTVIRKALSAPAPQPQPSREQIFASVSKSDTPASLGRRITTAKAPVVVDRSKVFAPQTAHDAPADLGRLIRFRQLQPSANPVPIRPSMAVPVPVQPPSKIGFQYALD